MDGSAHNQNRRHCEIASCFSGRALLADFVDVIQLRHSAPPHSHGGGDQLRSGRRPGLDRLTKNPEKRVGNAQEQYRTIWDIFFKCYWHLLSELIILGFCTADFWPALAYESAKQKPKHCLTWDFLSALIIVLLIFAKICWKYFVTKMSSTQSIAGPTFWRNEGLGWRSTSVKKEDDRMRKCSEMKQKVSENHVFELKMPGT